MTDRTKIDPDREGSAQERADVGDTPNEPSHRTRAGQEAAKGRLPAEHDHEHQSNYGGGGANGGAKNDGSG